MITMPTKKGKSGVGSSACYLKLNSVLDLAREACDFTGSVSPINAVKEGKSYRLFVMGEKIGDVRLLYYCDSNKIGKFCVYSPGEESVREEEFEIKDDISVEAPDLRLYKIPIIEFVKSPYGSKVNAKPEMQLVQVKDFASIVKVLISELAGEESGAPKVYGFFYKGEHFIGSYEIFHEGDTRFLAFAKVGQKGLFNSISYNYLDGRVETSNSFIGKSHMYVRVINLAEPFPSFKL